MVKFVINNNQNNLVLFVHGFTGGKDTWKNSSGSYFFDMLADDEIVKENVDIAYFEYFTTLSDFYATAKSVTGKLKSLFTQTFGKIQGNNSIEEISNILRSEIRFKLKSYDNIIIVAHSMGGLITKACALEENSNKIKLFISLAVPHLGSDAATLGKLFSTNFQIRDLAPLSHLIPTLNDQWVKLSRKPDIKYFYGTNDNIVKKISAIGTDNIEQDIIACNEDHVSISKPENIDCITYKATVDFIKEFLTGKTENLDFEIKELDDESQFEDEFFVLKLLLANVHQEAVKNAKENFLNAEYTRKFYSNAADQRKLAELYKKIRSLYRDSYAKFAAGTLKSSSELVNEIHEKIVNEDAQFLKTVIPLINGLHKKGMLHQLANDLEKDVWWSENKSIEALHSLKENEKNE